VDEAAGIFDAAAFGPFAGEVFGIFVPGEGGGAIGELFGAVEVEGRGEEGFFAEFAGPGELRDGLDGDGSAIGAGDGAVGCTEIDTEDGAG
jgi:hypothetical protein